MSHSLKHHQSRYGWAYFMLIVTHIVLSLLLVPQLMQADNFADWPMAKKIILGLIPIIPMAILIAAAIRYYTHIADSVQQRMASKATIGACLFTFLLTLTNTLVYQTTQFHLTPYWSLPVFIGGAYCAIYLVEKLKLKF